MKYFNDNLIDGFIFSPYNFCGRQVEFSQNYNKLIIIVNKNNQYLERMPMYYEYFYHLNQHQNYAKSYLH